MKVFFTKQERIFILFLLAGLIAGSGVELYQSRSKPKINITELKARAEIEQQIQVRTVLIDSILSHEPIASRTGGLDSGMSEVPFLKKMNPEAAPGMLRININTATAEELEQLPHVGPVLAKRIIDYRNVRGQFTNIEDLNKVKGIGDKKLSLIRPYIYIKAE